MVDTLYPVPGTGNSLQTNMGAYSKRRYAFAPQVQTAAAGTGTEITGSTINRTYPNVALSASVVIPARLVMASGHSVLVKRHIDHRENSAEAWAVYVGAEPPDLTVTALNDGSAQELDLGFDVDLSGAKSEIRLRATPDFSASGVDTGAFAAAIVLGGFDVNPPA